MARRIVNGQSGFLAITLAGANASGGLSRDTGPTRRGRVARVIVRIGTITGGGSVSALRLMLVSDAHTDATTVATIPAEALVWDSGDITVVASTTAPSLDVVLDKPACFAGGLRLVGAYTLTGTVSCELKVAIDLMDEV